MGFLLSFVFGAFIGSFLNVLIDRLSTGRGFIAGRSYCEHCKRTLKAQDLVPLISFLLLKGRCRYCHTKIPFRLFVVELTCGMVAVLLYLGFLGGIWGGLEAVLLGIILFCFLGIFVADIVYGIIPDHLVGVMGFFSLFFIYVNGLSFTNHLISAFATFAFFFLLFVVTRGRGMGFGDVKLSFVLGFLLGFPQIIVALYVAFLTGAAISMILVIWRKLRFFGGTIPFGPFLIGGTIIALFWGERLLSMFVSRFL